MQVVGLGGGEEDLLHPAAQEQLFGLLLPETLRPESTADNSILFNMPAEDRWEAAARLLGVDVNLLSSEAGHA